MPAIFSAAAQLLVKGAAKYEVKTTNWLIFIGLSLVSYMMAFGLYSFTVRNFANSIASPINTIAVMIIVFILAALLSYHCSKSTGNCVRLDCHHSVFTRLTFIVTDFFQYVISQRAGIQEGQGVRGHQDGGGSY